MYEFAANSVVLDDLIDLARQMRLASLSIFGSATTHPWTELSDLDVHLVVDAMTPQLWREVCTAANRSAQTLAESTGRPTHVELRHGPFKPDPADGPTMQLHLVVDDRATLAAAPFVLRLQRAVTAVTLVGELPFPTADGVPGRLAREAAAELHRWDRAEAENCIPYRAWSFAPTPVLAEGCSPVTTEWESRCLRRASSVVRRMYDRGLT